MFEMVAESVIALLTMAILSNIAAIINEKTVEHLHRQSGERGIVYIARIILFLLAYWVIALPSLVSALFTYAVEKPFKWLFMPKPDSPNGGKNDTN